MPRNGMLVIVYPRHGLRYSLLVKGGTEMKTQQFIEHIYRFTGGMKSFNTAKNNNE